MLGFLGINTVDESIIFEDRAELGVETAPINLISAQHCGCFFMRIGLCLRLENPAVSGFPHGDLFSHLNIPSV